MRSYRVNHSGNRMSISTTMTSRFGPVQRSEQRGLSIVELLVGIAVGLFVVAATAMLAATQMTENRKMLLEAQVQQDLRATADIITRELRRSGYWASAQTSVWSPSLAASANPTLTIAPISAPATAVSYHYTRPLGTNAATGFRLDSGAIQSDSLTAGVWQDLTDRRTLVITNFTVTPRHVSAPEVSPVQKLPCPKLCSDGTTDCWPTIAVREFQVDISGQAASDAAVQRTVRTIVRLRTEAASAACPA